MAARLAAAEARQRGGGGAAGAPGGALDAQNARQGDPVDDGGDVGVFLLGCHKT